MKQRYIKLLLCGIILNKVKLDDDNQ